MAFSDPFVRCAAKLPDLVVFRPFGMHWQSLLSNAFTGCPLIPRLLELSFPQTTRTSDLLGFFTGLALNFILPLPMPQHSLGSPHLSDHALLFGRLNRSLPENRAGRL